MHGPGFIDLGNPVSAHPLNRGLVGWWLPMPNNSGGSKLFDIKGRFHGTLTNGAAWRSGPKPHHRSILFDGSDDFVDISAAAMGGSVFTVVVAVNPTSIGTTHDDATVFSTSGYECYISVGGGHVNSYTSGAASWIDGSRPVPAGSWSLVAMTQTGGGQRELYSNGVFDTSGASSSALPAQKYLGRRVDGLSSQPTLSGRIGMAAIFTRALTASEHRALYHEFQAGYPNLLRRWSRKSFSTGGAAPDVYATTHRMFEGGSSVGTTWSLGP